MRYRFLSSVTVAIVLISASAQASSLVYRPVNPSFGGDAFNGSYLLSNAQANNSHERPARPVNTLENFERTITSSLLNRVSQQIADRIFKGDGTGQDSGNFVVGNTTIQYRRNGDTVDVTLVDGVTGASTTISVPSPKSEIG